MAVSRLWTGGAAEPGRVEAEERRSDTDDEDEDNKGVMVIKVDEVGNSNTGLFLHATEAIH